MEILLAVAAAFVVCWLWKARKRDRLTMLDFGVWRGWYEAPQSPLAKSLLAAAFLAQSLHYAVESGAIAAQHKSKIASVLKAGGANATLMSILGTGLPAVCRAVGESEVDRTPARAVGVLLLLAWMAPSGQGEEAVRRFLFRR